MILLNSRVPATTPDLLVCLANLLAQAITITPQTITATGQYPAIDKLTIDITRATPLDHPAATWSSDPGETVSEFTVASLEITGRPFGTGVREATIEASASHCKGQFIKAADNQLALRVAGAQSGQLRISVTRENVEAAALAQAAQTARAQGVEIKSVNLTWQTQGDKTLMAQILVNAKKGFLPAANLKVKGQLQIDDSLTATISNLSVDGEGMVGSIGAGLIRPKLMQAEGMKRSLLSLPLDAIKITGVSLQATNDALTIQATFAG